MIWMPDRETGDHIRRRAAGVFFLAAALALFFLDVPEFAPYKRLACIPVVCGAAWFVGLPQAMGSALLLAFGDSFRSGTLGSISEVLAHSSAANFLELATMALLATLLRQARARGHQAGRSDSLTGIANRAGFVERLEEELNRSRRTGKPLSLAYIDCDEFKAANDTLGHLAGDEILKQIAATIAANIRNYDCVGRLGGDEFAILFAEAGADTARSAAERIHSLLQECLAGGNWPVTCSIGVASFAQPAGTAEELLHAADEAMYEAKRSTRGSVRYVVG